MIKLVCTTVDSEAKAQALAKALVEGKLVACAQIVPITSIYHWDDELQSEPEWRLELKTLPKKLDLVLEFLSAQHPYEVPELLVLDGQVSQSYGQWMRAVLDP